MAIQGSGALAFTDIATEFGDTAPHSMSEFIRGGSLVPQADANNSIPTSTANMQFSDFYGAVNVIAQTISSTTTNVNGSTLFGSSWSESVPKELIINSGVIVGSSSTGTAALILPTGMGGTLTIKNSGSIQGAGGAANSGTGGDAILAQVSGITIENNGVIYSGGGGGGQGGNGSYQQSLGGAPGTCSPCGSCSQHCSNSFGGGAYCITDSRTGYPCGGEGSTYYCYDCRRDVSTTGGNGGVGQGYAQSAGTGSAGGTNAGTGGNGGAFGATGSTGANGTVTNGVAGGLAGYYVNGIGNVTFSVTGTVAGRTT